MNMLQVKLPDSATDITLPKLNEIVIEYPNDNKGFGVSNTNTSYGVRCENATMTRTFPTPQVAGVTYLPYIGSSMAVSVTPTGADPMYVFLGAKQTIGILSFGNHTAPVNIIRGDLSKSNIFSLDCTWLKYKGENYPVELLPWNTLTTVSYNFDNDHGMGRTLKGNLGNCNLTSRLTALKINGQNSVTINVDNDFENAIGLVDLRIAENALVTGDISSLGHLTNLEVLSINNSKNITGTLESLFDAMYSNGRHSGTITVYAILTNVTYNGVVPAAAVSVTFTNEGWSK